MIELAVIAACALFVTQRLRWPSDALFAEAETYYAAAERMQRLYRESETSFDGIVALCKRDICLRQAHALARKAIRRMPMRLL